VTARVVARAGTAALAIALAPLLAACVSGLRSRAPPTVSYVLRAAPRATAGASTPEPPETRGTGAIASKPAGVTLRVLRPLAAPGLDSDHIVLARSDRRLTWYAATRWAAPLPDVVESVAVETLRGSARWRAIEDSRGVAAMDDFLQITIRRFEAEETGGSAPVVHVALDCTLGRSDDRSLLTSFSVEREVPAAENRLGAVVAAFERAADEALAEVAQRASDAATRADRTG
jgi:ABC-type uncharacterized transport system auxiliary subunit